DLPVRAEAHLPRSQPQAHSGGRHAHHPADPAERPAASHECSQAPTHPKPIDPLKVEPLTGPLHVRVVEVPLPLPCRAIGATALVPGVAGAVFAMLVIRGAGHASPARTFSHLPLSFRFLMALMT